MASRISSVLILFVVIFQLYAQTGEARWLAQEVVPTPSPSPSPLPPCPPGIGKDGDKVVVWKDGACIFSGGSSPPPETIIIPSPSPSPSHSPTPANTGVDVHKRCPEGCKPGYCILHTAGGYMCDDCVGNLIVNRTDGTCGCPAGQYGIANFACTDCPKGEVCPGGQYGSTDRIGCGANMTTTGKRVSSRKGCINTPGTFFAYTAEGDPVASPCPPDTYSAGFKKQRSCVPCPSGLTTNGVSGCKSQRDCVLPSGYFLKGPGIMAACPKGEYKFGVGSTASCKKCAFGVTTAKEASVSVAACTVLLPGFAPSNWTDNFVAAAQRCPQKHYCPGGAATTAFNPSTPDAIAGTTMVRCTSGAWTMDIGASSPDQCMVPPGHEVVAGTTQECLDGYYRPEWVQVSGNNTCKSCGDGFSSQPTDEITVYALTPDATPARMPVRTGGSTCYARAGQGVFYSASTNTYSVRDCGVGQYGLPNATYGLDPFPCRDCPKGMTTSKTFAQSAQYYVEDSAGRGGFTDIKACVTMPGWAYRGRTAERCPAGTWAAPGAGSCNPCPFGLSTPDDPWAQMSEDNCTLAPGFGSHGGNIQACPIGTYNDVLRPNRIAPCTACPTGLSTSQTGGLTLDDCNVMALGWGTTESGTGSTRVPCGGTARGSYGPVARGIGSACVSCPDQTTGFSFDFLAVNRLFQPTVVSRLYADSPADCLNEFNQVMDAAWQMGGSAQMTAVAGVTTLDGCVAACNTDSSCQYITFDYDTSVCSKRVSKTGNDLIAYKATVAGDTTAASIKTEDDTAVANALASGAYTFWARDDAAGVGATITTTNPVASITACLSLCDVDRECAAAVMIGITTADSAPTACKLVRGDSSVGVFKRSMTRTVVDRLSRASIVGV